MKTLKLLSALVAVGIVGSPAAAQMTNSMGNMGSAPMAKGTMPSKMPMHQMMGPKMKMCHKMTHRQMMHNRQCMRMMKQHRIMNHHM